MASVAVTKRCWPQSAIVRTAIYRLDDGQDSDHRSCAEKQSRGCGTIVVSEAVGRFTEDRKAEEAPTHRNHEATGRECGEAATASPGSPSRPFERMVSNQPIFVEAGTVPVHVSKDCYTLFKIQSQKRIILVPRSIVKFDLI